MAAELLLPEAIADYGAGQPAAVPVVVRCKEPSANRVDAKDVEELAAYIETIYKSGIAARITGEGDCPAMPHPGKPW